MSEPLSDWQKEILARHFDPQDGAPCWLDKLRERGLTGAEPFETLADLWRLGPQDEEALRRRPVGDFIPRGVREKQPPLIRSETGGATGQAKKTVFTETEFERNFVAPFVTVADACAFPRQALWLWIGPSGPHIIGRAAAALARATSNADPLAVDFDPRWFRRLAEGSMGRLRYLNHILEQALHHVRTEPVEVLFATPAILDVLAPQMSEAERRRVRGVHYGGISLTPERYRQYREEWFPRAVHLSGYGNSLFGCCLEIPDPADAAREQIQYFPPNESWRLQLVDRAFEPGDPRPPRLVDYGQRGRVLAHRFTESFLILNLLERDEATRVAPHAKARELGFDADGLADPDVAEPLKQQITKGIY